MPETSPSKENLVKRCCEKHIELAAVNERQGQEATTESKPGENVLKRRG